MDGNDPFLDRCIVFIFTLLRGGHGAESPVGAACGDSLFWVLFCANLFILFVFTIIIRQIILKR